MSDIWQVYILDVGVFDIGVEVDLSLNLERISLIVRPLENKGCNDVKRINE